MPTYENARNKIVRFIEDGLLDWEMVCRECDWDDDNFS